MLVLWSCSIKSFFLFFEPFYHPIAIVLLYLYNIFDASLM